MHLTDFLNEFYSHLLNIMVQSFDIHISKDMQSNTFWKKISND